MVDFSIQNVIWKYSETNFLPYVLSIWDDVTVYK